MTTVNIVVGPPAGGKNTYIEKNAKPGAVIVDQDRINMAFGADHRKASKDHRRVGYAARQAAITKICKDGIDTDSWIIHTNPSPSQIEYYGAAGARFHVIAPPQEETLARAQEDGRSADIIDIIKQWYENPPQIPAAWIAQKEKKGAAMKTKTAHAVIKAFQPGVKDEELQALKEGEFIAYASTFVKEPDAYGDIIAPGAFTETLEEWAKSGNTIPILYGHRFDDPEYNIGGTLEAKQDEHGLRIKGSLDLDTSKSRQVYKLVKGGRLTQLSFAFDVLEEGTVELEDGRTANELRKVKIYEISLVPIGANQTTEVLAVKEATGAIAENAKAGRTLSAKNEQTLRQAAEQLKSVASSIAEILQSTEPEAGKASDAKPAKQTPAPATPALNLSDLIQLRLITN